VLVGDLILTDLLILRLTRWLIEHSRVALPTFVRLFD